VIFVTLSIGISLFGVYESVYDSIRAHLSGRFDLPVIAPQTPRAPKITLSTRIDVSLRVMLDEHCQFAQCGREHIVSESLRRTFQQDAEFQAWRKRAAKPIVADLLRSNVMMKAGAAPLARIFLAEDNPADVYLIEQALREHGVAFDLEVAEDGKQALRFLRSDATVSEASHPGLILLDLNLPQHDGTEILRCIRQSRLLAAVPVVVFTSSDSPKDRHLAMQSGATRYFRKPSSLKEFLAIGATLKELLRGQPDPEDPS
jgi:CheY-like chemotaxis protein